MASIFKRPGAKTYNVIYDVYEQVEVDGKLVTRRKPVWITGLSYKEAKDKKLKVEQQQKGGILVNPNNMTIGEFMLEWLDYYKKLGNAVSTCGIVSNCLNQYIIPDLGERKLQTLSSKDVEDYFLSLRNRHHARSKYRYFDWNEEDIPTLSSTTIRHIYVYFNMALDKAVEWELIPKNPVLIPPPPKADNPTEAWDEETLYMALSEIKDPLLHLCLHIAFICSSRAGEIGGITWDNIDWDEGSIQINKVIQRLKKQDMAESTCDPPLLVFPNKIGTRPEEEIKSCLVLKKPKTKKSTRIVYLTDHLLAELKRRRQLVDKRKVVLGENYQDYNLVVCLEDGTPIEPKLIAKWFKKFIQRNHGIYPTVKLHSIRSTSTTYKLVVSKGDIKSVQGDTGHATAKMVTDTYAKIQDKSRKKMAKALEQNFYKDGKQPQGSTPAQDAAARVQASKQRETLAAPADPMQTANNQMLLQKLQEKVMGNPEALETLLSALQML